MAGVLRVEWMDIAECVRIMECLMAERHPELNTNVCRC